jgi:hypothetical protein
MSIEDDADLVTVLSTTYPSELAMAESLLQAVGIDYVVADDDDADTVEIRVRREHAAAARDVLDDLR